MRRSRPKKRHWVRYSLLILLAIVLVVGGGFAYHFIKLTRTGFNQMYAPKGTHSTAIKKGQPFSVLILGVDTGADGRVDKGNSDTLMVATVNPTTKRTILYSIPRDTLVELRGDGKRDMQKLNAAYNVGGIKMARQTVSQLLGIPIDYYLTMNMGGLKKMVDAVGGITVHSPMDVQFDDVRISKGTHHLNGKQALGYARMRYQDPNGDYGRQMRQQEVIRAVVNKITKKKRLSDYQALLTALAPNVRTDVDFNGAVHGLLKYRANLKQLTSRHLQGQDAWINGSSYQIASTAELVKVHRALRQELDLPAKQLDNEETRLNALNPTFDGDKSQLYNTFGLDTVYYTNNTY